MASSIAVPSQLEFPGLEYPDPTGPTPANPNGTLVMPALQNMVRATDGKVERQFALDVRVSDLPIWRPGELQGVGMEPSKGMDLFCMEMDTSTLPSLHIVAFEPLLTMTTVHGISDSRVAAGDVVHHMLLQACSRPGRVGRGQVYACDMDDEPDAHCEEVMVMYDRGGGTFWLPEGVGMRLGQHSPYNTLLLEMHYLPQLYKEQGLTLPQEGLLDSSGIRLHVTPDLRPHDAAVFGLSGENIALDPGLPVANVDFGCPGWFAARQLDAVRVPGEPLGIFAVHPHMHGFGKAISIDLVRAGGTEFENVVNMTRYGGYGPDQTIMHARLSAAPGATVMPHGTSAQLSRHQRERWAGNIGSWPKSSNGRKPSDLRGLEPVGGGTLGSEPEREGSLWRSWGGPPEHFGAESRRVTVQPGDGLRVRCTFDTTHSEGRVYYGLDVGQEMCAPLVFVAPINGSARMPSQTAAELGWPCNPPTGMVDASLNQCVRTREILVPAEPPSHVGGLEECTQLQAAEHIASLQGNLPTEEEIELEMMERHRQKELENQPGGAESSRPGAA